MLINGIPMHPVALILVFIVGFIWLLSIVLRNEKNKYEKEKLIDDIYYIYPVTMMCFTLVCLVHQFYTCTINADSLLSDFF